MLLRRLLVEQDQLFPKLLFLNCRVVVVMAISADSDRCLFHLLTSVEMRRRESL